MKMKFAVFLLPLIFINFIQQINCFKEIKNNGCQNWTKILQDQSMIEVTKEALYRFFLKKNGIYSFFLGNEPLTIWMDLRYDDFFSAKAKPYGHPQGNDPSTFFQINGRSDCQYMINGSYVATNLIAFFVNLTCSMSCFRDCFTSCPRYQEKYTPVTMWSENGPIEVESIAVYSNTPFKLYLPESQMNEFIAAKECKQTKWLKDTFPTSDYSHLKSDPNEVFKNESGISSVRLNNYGDTVVWVEIKDSSPEHFVIIKMEDDSQILKEEDFMIGIEANGLEPVSFDLEKNSTKMYNGIKIYLKKVICVGNYHFLGHIRYIFNVNSSTTNNYSFIATFYDSNDTNVEVKYLEEEKNGIPKPYSEPYKFEYYILSIVPTTTTTTTTPSSTSTSTSTSSIEQSTIENVPDGIDKTSSIPILSPQKEIPSKAAAKIHGFFLLAFIAILMV